MVLVRHAFRFVFGFLLIVAIHSRAQAYVDPCGALGAGCPSQNSSSSEMPPATTPPPLKVPTPNEQPVFLPLQQPKSSAQTQQTASAQSSVSQTNAAPAVFPSYPEIPLYIPPQHAAPSNEPTPIVEEEVLHSGAPLSSSGPSSGLVFALVVSGLAIVVSLRFFSPMS